MVNVIEVKTKKQQKEFLNFPLNLYKNNPYFVPPLYMDEKKIFRKDYVYYDTCIAKYYNAYIDNKIVGRISCFIQKSSNEKWNQKRVRFTRFDAIDNKEVAKALFDKVESFAKENKMDEIVGPLGFSDLEREGLLIDGFDELATFEEQYNYDYYQKLIEDNGYDKDVDWIESKIYYPDFENDRLEKFANLILKRYKLHFINEKNINDFINKYGDQFFKVLDKTYENIYGTVPFTDGMKKMTISNFKLVLNINYVGAIANENDEIVCFGLCMPSLAKALQKSNGHLTLPAIYRVLRDIKNPKIIDLALIGVLPEYENKGVASAIILKMKEMLQNRNIDHCETNLNLEDNAHILNQWQNFKAIRHKRRRCFIKKLNIEKEG